MSNNSIVERTTAIFRTIFKDPNLTLTNSLTAKDVERWDSLNHVTLIAAIEKEFSITFKFKELNKMECVGDLLTLIREKLS